MNKSPIYNMTQHALNGNKEYIKTKNHITVVQLNTGLSNWDNNIHMMKLELEEAKLDIAIFGESNMTENEPGLSDNFEDFNI